MTDRIKALTVHLECDIRDDDVEEIARAIKCMRFVSTVDNKLLTSDDEINRMRIRNELKQKLWDVLT